MEKKEREENASKIAAVIQKVSGDAYEAAYSVAKKFEELVYSKTHTRAEYVSVIKERLLKILKRSQEVLIKRQSELDSDQPESAAKKPPPRKDPGVKSPHKVHSARHELKRSFDRATSKETAEQRFITGLAFIEERKLEQRRFLYVLRKSFSRAGDNAHLQVSAPRKDEKIFLEGGRVCFESRGVSVLLAVDGDVCRGVELSPCAESETLIKEINAEIEDRRCDKIDSYIEAARSAIGRLRER
ncbi:MAG: uncharacterized protein A8A55_2091 [Amphiamblys sp. WSBS2006]|nr:MAG: uncharacterized protein A8A55_2091 [Amphiamblys sp. WSBS2006]